MEKIFFYDLETTGLDPDTCAIHQLSALIRVNGTVVKNVDIKIRPFEGAEIHEKALQVGGVTREQIMAYPTEAEAFVQLQSILSQYVSKYDKLDKFHLSGYNIMGFDNNFLRKFWLRNNDKYFGSLFWSDCIDVMSEASSFLRMIRPTLPNFQLKTVAKLMRIEIDESKLHNAVYDVELTMEIFDRINKVRKQIK